MEPSFLVGFRVLCSFDGGQLGAVMQLEKFMIGKGFWNNFWIDFLKTIEMIVHFNFSINIFPISKAFCTKLIYKMETKEICWNCASKLGKYPNRKGFEMDQQKKYIRNSAGSFLRYPINSRYRKNWTLLVDVNILSPTSHVYYQYTKQLLRKIQSILWNSKHLKRIFANNHGTIHIFIGTKLFRTIFSKNPHWLEGF